MCDWLWKVGVIADELVYSLARDAEQLSHLCHPDQVELFRHGLNSPLTYDNNVLGS
jgi:hypothetical protein